MDKEAHEENSSSRNVNDNVERGVIRAVKRGSGPGIAKVILEDGSSFFMGMETLAAQRLAAGDTVGVEERERFEQEAMPLLAYEKGVALLARREHGTRELELKLQKRNFPSNAIQSAIIRLRDEGYLDDRRFTWEWLTARVRKTPESRNRLMLRLREKGVAEDVIREVLDDNPETADETILLERCLSKLMRQPAITPEKAIRRLLSRGFYLAPVRRIVAETFQQEERDEE